MPPFVDLTGQQFGRLKVIEITPRPATSPSRKGRTFWRCICECGQERTVITADLRNGHSTSCGCKRGTGITHINGKMHPLWTIWINMKRRCSDPANKNFKDYGGRGVTVCERWLQFEFFMADLVANIGQRPSMKHTLDRIDNDGNYELGNVRWATAKEQRRNQRAKRKYPEVIVALLGFGC